MDMTREAIAEYKGVYVFAQQVDNVIGSIAYELLGKAKDLAAPLNTEVVAVLIGSDVKGLPGSLEELVDVSYKRLAFTIHDENTKKIRKFFVMEQFRNDKIRDFLTQFQITSVESINKMMFEHLLKIGKVKEYDPDLLAFEFSFPITIMIQLIDREPEREQEAMERIRKHMDHFVEVYSK